MVNSYPYVFKGSVETLIKATGKNGGGKGNLFQKTLIERDFWSTSKRYRLFAPSGGSPARIEPFHQAVISKLFK